MQCVSNTYSIVPSNGTIKFDLILRIYLRWFIPKLNRSEPSFRSKVHAYKVLCQSGMKLSRSRLICPKSFYQSEGGLMGRTATTCSIFAVSSPESGIFPGIVIKLTYRLPTKSYMTKWSTSWWNESESWACHRCETSISGMQFFWRTSYTFFSNGTSNPNL
jgi:hypothetical protein